MYVISPRSISLHFHCLDEGIHVLGFSYCWSFYGVMVLMCYDPYVSVTWCSYVLWFIYLGFRVYICICEFIWLGFRFICAYDIMLHYIYVN
jgi:hypothetical protein